MKKFKLILSILSILLFSACIFTNNDREDPVVWIDIPQEGAQVGGNGISIEVKARDNILVEYLILYVNDEIAGFSTDTNAYFLYTDSLEVGNQYEIYAKAFDEAGNIGISESVTCTFIEMYKK